MFLNKFSKLSLLAFATSSTLIPLSSAMCWATNGTYAGVLVLPRCGAGAKYGLSVSINKRLRGSQVAISFNSLAFLKVTIPENEI